MAVKSETKCGTSRRKSAQSVTFCIKEERNAMYKKVSSILQKSETERNDEEKELLFSCSELVKEVTRRIEKRKKVKERLQEVEDPPDLLAEKCHKLAEAVAGATNLVVYTGAGISTSACIPDYRGTNGIWTLLQKGKDIGLHDLTQAEPTITHMALWQLYKAGILKHVVSQNCDGLHLRSGLPRRVLSEVHGNMYIEVCCQCKPAREYWRLFDVTEHTARFNHRTMRKCYTCMGPLVDTIVHFGERGKLTWPLNWSTASKAADKADVILCIGSSLKVLKKYPWLWGMDKPAKKRPKLYIVNLQWTPKDDQAILKISGKCDEVMRQVMSHINLAIPNYIRNRDPIFNHATALDPVEAHTTSQPLLKQPQSTCQDIDGSDMKLYGEVSVDFGGDISPKVEIDVDEKHKSSCDTFHFVSTVTDISLVDDTSNDKIEDPLAVMEGQNCSNGSSQMNNTMTILIEENWFPNTQQILNSDSDPLLIEDAVASGGLILDLDVSSDQFENYNQGSCDQNSLQFEDIIVECSTSLNSEDLSSLIGNNTHTSSISSLGCDSGVSSINGSLFVLDDPSSVFSISAVTRVLQLEHSYSKIPVNESHTTEESSTRVEDELSLGDNKMNQSCKRIKTNRTENPLQSSSPQSTKTLAGKLTTSDEKQICDDKCDVGNTTMCSFCKLNYSSNVCLFYRQWTSKFENISLGSRICECCDTDEDDDTDVETGTCKTDVSIDSNKIAKVPNVNPGWYGKGYRKRTKRKRLEKI